MSTPAPRWPSRPLLARLVRWFALLAPLVIAVGAAWWVGRQLPAPGTVGEAVAMWVLLSLLSTGVLALVDRGTRRLLPLAALLQLSLVFPDRAPSRFEVARALGTTRQLEEEIARAREHGIGTDRAAAATTVLRLVAALSQHDRATAGHAERVRVYVDMIAEELELPEDDVDRLRWGALLHDVGKISVHPDVLNKDGPPTDEEWDLIRRHPLEGARIAAPLRGWLGSWVLAIEQHHERWDGDGYPYGLAGDEISLAARIVSVADAFDVMTAARSYKEPIPTEDARAELAACAGSQFDPEVVRAFLGISLTRLRLAVGPWSWLANTPAARPLSVPALRGLGTVVAAGVAAVTGIAAYGWLPDDAPSPAVVVAEDDDAPLATEEPTPLPLPSPSPSPDIGPSPSPAAAPSPAPGVAPVADEAAEPVVPVGVPVPPGPSGGGVTAEDAPPVLIDDVATGLEDEALVVAVLDNDSDPEGTALRLTSVEHVTAPLGTIGVTDGRITYTPTPDVSGVVTLRYGATDGTTEQFATVDIVILPVDDAPMAAPDTGTTREDVPVSLDVLANDTDVDGDVLTVVAATADRGTAVVEPDGRVRVTPPADEGGVVSVTYTLSDGTSAVPGTATVSVTPVNDPPSFVLGAAPVASGVGGPVTVPGWLSGLDAGAPDEAAQGLTVTVTVDDPTLFLVLPSIDAAGTLSFSLPAGVAGTATLTVTVTDDGGTADGGVDRATATTTLTVTAPDAPPVAIDDAVALDEDSDTTFTPVTNDIDPEGGPLTLVGYDDSGLTLGRIEDLGGGLLRYVGLPHANGVDAMTYTVSDGTSTATGLVRFTVIPSPDAPTVGPDAYLTQLNTDLSVVGTSGLLVNDGDEDGDVLVIDTTSVVQPPAGEGSVLVNADGSFFYTAGVGFLGTTSFQYDVTDGLLRTTATATVTVVSGSSSLALYLTPTVVDATTSALDVSPPPPAGDPPTDHDGDGSPGLSIARGGTETGSDPDTFHEWTWTASADLTLLGPASVELHAAVAGLAGGQPLDISAWLWKCPSDGTVCVRLAAVEGNHYDGWNPPGVYVTRQIRLGLVDQSLIAGDELRLRIATGHATAWLPLTGDPPSLLQLTTS